VAFLLLGQPTDMLKNLSDNISACYEHSDYCARKAATEIDTQLKQDYLVLEQRWLSLARSYEVSERLSDFSAEHSRKSGSK
jgi:hypothetical protein